jgi:hypothetical protein
MKVLGILVLSFAVAGVAIADGPKTEYVTRKFIDTHKCEIQYGKAKFPISKSDLSQSEEVAVKVVYKSIAFGSVAAYASISESNGEQFLKFAVLRSKGVLSGINLNPFGSSFNCAAYSATRLGQATVKLESGKVDLAVTGADDAEARIICD